MPAPPFQSSGFSLDHQTYPYLQYQLRAAYQYDAGDLQIPVAYQTGTTLQKSVELVQVAQPAGRKVVSFSIRRLGLEPVVPDPTPTDPNLVLLTAVVVPGQPVLATDGKTYAYSVEGEYTYALLRPVFTAQGLTLPRTPVEAGYQHQTLPAGQFSGGLV